MKKSLLGLMVLMFALVACEGPKGDGMNWEVVTITVGVNDWETIDDADGSYFRCIKQLRGLSNEDYNYIYQWGNTSAYQVIRPRQSNEVQTPLPFTLHLTDQVVDWTETVYFDYLPGDITFYVQYSDFATNINPGERVFRVVMNW